MDKLELFTDILFVLMALGGLTGLSLLVSVACCGAATTIEFWERAFGPRR